MTIPNPCLSCGTLTVGTRCVPCAASRPRRPTTAARGLGSKHRRLAADAIERQPWCSFCGHPGSEDNPLTADHIVPRAKGGTNAASNYQTLCRKCNSAKGARRG